MPNLKEKFKIHPKVLFSLFKENIILIVGMAILIPVYNYFKDEHIVLNSEYLSIMGVFLIVINFPALILLVNYYLENKKTILEIDVESDLFRLTKNGTKKEHKITDIIRSTYILGKYHQNRIDNKGRWKMLNSDFGYWNVQFRDETEYYLSNLLVDFLLKKPFIENTNFKFTMFPFIDKSGSRVEKSKEKRKKIDRLDYLIELYSEKSNQELEEIVNSKNSYQPIAVRAAKKVLEEKTLGNKG